MPLVGLTSEPPTVLHLAASRDRFASAIGTINPRQHDLAPEDGNTALVDADGNGFADEAFGCGKENLCDSLDFRK